MIFGCGLATFGIIIALLSSEKTRIPGVVSVIPFAPMVVLAVSC
jgi:hypothetical protein